MPERGKSDFEREYETNNHRAHLSAVVLIAGLFLELVNAIIWFHGIETIAGMIAVLLIVGGVWGEVFFANKARRAGDKQLAQFEAATAEANARAVEAQLQLEKWKRPRSLPLWKFSEYERLLKPFEGTPYRLMAMDDPEQLLLAQRLKMVLDWADWQEKRQGYPEIKGIELIPEFDGIEIRIDESRHGEWWGAVQAITTLLAAEDIDVAARALPSETPKDAIDIIIGRRR